MPAKSGRRTETKGTTTQPVATVPPRVKSTVTDRWTVSAGHGAPKSCPVSIRRIPDRKCWFVGSCSRWATATGFTPKTFRESPTWYFAQSVKLSSCMAVFGTDTTIVDLRDFRNREKNSGFRSWKQIASGTSVTAKHCANRDGKCW